MRRILLSAIIITTALGLGGCSFPRAWHPSGERFAVSEPFSQALRSCVAAYDPARLRRLTGSEERQSLYPGGDSGGYQVYGFKEPEERYRPVTDCMRMKGWVSVTSTILFP